MYTLKIKYSNNITFISKISLFEFRHFLKYNKYKKPYKPTDKYLIKHTLNIMFDSSNNEKEIINFKLIR